MDCQITCSQLLNCALKIVEHFTCLPVYKGKAHWRLWVATANRLHHCNCVLRLHPILHRILCCIETVDKVGSSWDLFLDLERVLEWLSTHAHATSACIVNIAKF